MTPLHAHKWFSFSQLVLTAAQQAKADRATDANDWLRGGKPEEAPVMITVLGTNGHSTCRCPRQQQMRCDGTES